MDDGNKEDWEDQEWWNKIKGRCGKHKWENKRSETEMVTPCVKKDWKRCSNENMDNGSGMTHKDRKTEAEWVSDVIKKDLKEKWVKIEDEQTGEHGD